MNAVFNHNQPLLLCRVSTTPGNLQEFKKPPGTPGNLQEFEKPPGNPGNLLEFTGPPGNFCVR